MRASATLPLGGTVHTYMKTDFVSISYNINSNSHTIFRFYHSFLHQIHPCSHLFHYKSYQSVYNFHYLYILYLQEKYNSKMLGKYKQMVLVGLFYLDSIKPTYIYRYSMLTIHTYKNVRRGHTYNSAKLL